MATLLGTDTFQRQTVKPALALGRETSVDIREVVGTYTCTGAEVTGDIVPLFKLPIGAILIPKEMFVSTDAVGGTSVVFSKIGDAGDDDRYSATSVALTAAQTDTQVTPTNAIAVTPFTVDTEANQTVLATMTHSGAPTAGKKIFVRARYRLP